MEVRKMYKCWRILLPLSCSCAALACGAEDTGKTSEFGSTEQAIACEGLPAWSVRPFTAGERVESAGQAYECKPYPFTGWCGLAPAYQPGVGWAWQDAWIPLGQCDGGPD